LKKFFVVANLVRQHPVDELVSQLKSRKIISKEQVIRESKNNIHLLCTLDSAF
jgi:E3 SUMO-protein ligase PIAS1